MSDNPSRAEPDAAMAGAQGDMTGTLRDTAPDAGIAGGGGETAAERLLLTPAQRINTPADAPDPPPLRRARVQTRTLTMERISLEQRIAELERAVGDTDAEWEPDGSEDADQETPHSFLFAKTGDQREPAPTEDEIRQVADSLIDEGEALRQSFAPVSDQVEDAEILPPLDAAPDPVPDPEPPEPVEAEAESQVTRLHLASDSVVPEADPAPAEEARHPQAEDDPDDPFDLGEDRVIDEEVLRDLVAEIVRSELQGELGERITRNVRKLVRREIHRAIMTRDFG